ncbi:bifunctional enoyl-CoA hydratase/phosphate acetyltransferase [Amaricoccus macauensis]|uniref:bifunctional enoyl-CoA hydratase/phosphate acetyltransferase n=1 Tax=Amaricoccus macauensis TaxID=57001 RepID=UPI003C79E31E
MITENKTYDELQIGDSYELHRVCTVDDFYIFAVASGNHNPMHLPDTDREGGEREEPVAPSMWCGSIVSAVLGNILPGPGTLYCSQHFDFVGRAHAGDELVIKVMLTAKNEDGTVVFATHVRRAADDVEIVRGEAVVVAPTEKITQDDHDLPGLVVQRHRHFDALIRMAEPLPPIPTAIVCPEEPNSLGGAILAAKRTIISPILIGNRDKISAAASELGADISGFEMIEINSHAEAANAGVELVRAGRAKALMKGHLHTDDLLRAALNKQTGLRAGRRFTHVFVLDVPGMPHPLIVSDAAINIAPDLPTKIDIVQNAIDLAISIGIQVPKVGVLSAVETVNPAIPSSVDAALLSKMADRGQITGGLVEGPLAMDNAVDLAAARTKGIKSDVAGRAEVLVVPDLDAGNMLAKQLTYIAKAEAAGLVMGASCPIILTSRADDDMARLASCAVAAIHHARMSGRDIEKLAAE